MTSSDDGAVRVSARIAVAIGALGSVGFLLANGKNTPRLLLVAMAIWVLSPFAVLKWAHRISPAWASVTRRALYYATFFITAASLVTYARLIKPPAGSPAGFVFVVVPPFSWLVIAVALAMAKAISRKRAQ